MKFGQTYSKYTPHVERVGDKRRREGGRCEVHCHRDPPLNLDFKRRVGWNHTGDMRCWDGQRWIPNEREKEHDPFNVVEKETWFLPGTVRRPHLNFEVYKSLPKERAPRKTTLTQRVPLDDSRSKDR